jgi:hypothetical protein
VAFLCDAAREQSRQGFKSDAEKTCRIAFAVADGIKDFAGRNSSRKNIITALAEIGKYDIAKSLVSSIEDPAKQLEAVSAVSLCQAIKGDKRSANKGFREADKLISKIRKASERYEVLATLAYDLGEIGLHDKAVYYVKKIPDPGKRTHVYRNLAFDLMEKDKKGTKKVVNLAYQSSLKIKDRKKRSANQKDVIYFQTELGLFSEAAKKVDKIDDPEYRASAYAEMASKLKKKQAVDMFEKSISLAAGIKDKKSRSRAQGSIVSSLIERYL